MILILLRDVFIKKNDDKPFLQIQEDAFLKRLPVGFYDNSILCAECDNSFSVDEGYAKQIFNDAYLQKYKQSGDFGTMFVLNKGEFDYYKIRRFLLSMVWKASISKKPECECVNLGLYEDMALHILKGTIKDNPNLFKIFVFKFKEPQIAGLVFVTKSRMGGDIVYCFVAGGFLFCIFPTFGFNQNNKLFEHFCLSPDSLKIVEVNKHFNGTHEMLLNIISKQVAYTNSKKRTKNAKQSS